MMQSVLAAYGFEEETARLEAFGSGLINHTWKVTVPEGQYILQKLNHAVFKRPDCIAQNIRLVAAYLQQLYPDYRFVSPLVSGNGSDMIYLKGEGYFRMFPFVADSQSKEIVETPDQAFEAAVQFGRFTRLLSGFDVNQLEVTIPHFHDLELRYQQFLASLENGNPQRLAESDELIKTLNGYADIAAEYSKIKVNPEFKLRVTHHDTKISNVLFDAKGKGICVIDLDTIMPGYFISDVGDMMRTYLSPVSEEEKNVDKIEIRDDFYKAIMQGYGNQMKDELTAAEKQSFFYAGKFMIYMQALRFLADHLNDDVYYGVKYPGHNFIRAKNQTVLLQRLLEKESALAKYKV
jgi:Ser/Thr protein kinase RdoA (MazF antagonist)